jgi:hypothetical protein
VTWYEECGKGWRARWRPAPKVAPLAGPVKATRDDAVAWAIAAGVDKPVSLVQMLRDYCATRRADPDDQVADSYLLETEDRLGRLFTRRSWSRVADITIAAIDKWRTDTKGIGVSRLLAYLLAFLRWAEHHRDAAVDPKVLTIRRKRQRRTLAPALKLTDEDVQRILAKGAGFGPHVVALLHYLTTYGARPITACTLTIGQVDFAAGTLRFGAKTSGEGGHPLLRLTLDLFAACAAGRGPDQPLFLDPRTITDDPADARGWPVDSRHSATSLCGWYWRHIGKPVCVPQLAGLYNLKRYAITRMLAQGIDPVTVAEFTLHLTLSQVLIYARTDSATARAALTRLHPVRIGSRSQRKRGVSGRAHKHTARKAKTKRKSLR